MLMKMIDRRSDLAAMPMWIPHAALCVGFALIALITFWRLIAMLVKKPELEGHPTMTGF
jgi:TRAP-type C4-dicarboxylate transport system permease small subunit